VVRPVRPSSAAVVAALLAFAALIAGPRPADAQDRTDEKGVVGVGLIVGEPLGLSAKYYLADDRAIDAAVGFAYVGRGWQGPGDYLWHPWLIERTESFAMPFYLGVGGRVLAHDGGSGDDEHTRIGLRVPFGILFDFTRVPLDTFVEIVPVFDYRTRGDAFGFDVNAGAGVRYYF
jgi:hypothetical protein